MRAVPALLVALPIALAACGGSGSGDGSGGGGHGIASACPKGAVVIHMRNIAFSPKTATAKVGEKVCWINDDDVQHDAAADSGRFHSPLYGKGHSFTTRLTKAGSISYVCTVHPGMTGTLRVKP